MRVAEPCYKSPSEAGESPDLDVDFQKPAGHRAGKLALGDPLKQEDDLKRSLPTSTVLWFCNKTEGNVLQWRLQHKVK